MTRYTKLDKRRPEYVKASQRAGSSEPESEASTSAVRTDDFPATTPVKAMQEEEDDQKEKKVAADSQQQIAEEGKQNNKQEFSEPSKLLKRAKLIRLKAKKANDPSKKQNLLRQVRELEQQATFLNGQNGAAGKGKTSKRGPASRGHDESGNAATSAGGGNPWKVMEAERRQKSEAKASIRRDKRQQERLSTQRCLACREMGHSAKDCPNQKASNGSRGEEQMICCYRCGSTEHSLAKCKRSAPKVGPELPFASCYICGEKGHIASKCSQNQGRGIYPNGGSCKLCQSVEHLAKDCQLNSNAAGVNAVSNAAIGLGYNSRTGGADEDDFHSLSRKRSRIEQDDRIGQSMKRQRPQKKIVSF